MSGNFSRLQYDDCAFQTAVRQSTNPYSYSMYVGKFENGTNTHLVFPCADATSATCAKCDANAQAIPNDMSSIGTRVDIHSDLLNITRPGTRCPELKFKPVPQCAADAADGTTKCSEVRVVTPGVCSRHIVPTNMRMPASNGIDM